MTSAARLITESRIVVMESPSDWRGLAGTDQLTSDVTTCPVASGSVLHRSLLARVRNLHHQSFLAVGAGAIHLRQHRAFVADLSHRADPQRLAGGRVRAAHDLGVDRAAP